MLDCRLFDPLAIGVAHPSLVAHADLGAGSVIDELDQLTSEPNGLLTTIELNGESPVLVEIPNYRDAGDRRCGQPVDLSDQTSEPRIFGCRGGQHTDVIPDA